MGGVFSTSTKDQIISDITSFFNDIKQTNFRLEKDIIDLVHGLLYIEKCLQIDSFEVNLKYFKSKQWDPTQTKFWTKYENIKNMVVNQEDFTICVSSLPQLILNIESNVNNQHLFSLQKLNNVVNLQEKIQNINKNVSSLEDFTKVKAGAQYTQYCYGS